MSEHRRVLSFVNEEEIEYFFEKFCNWTKIGSNSDIEGGGIDTIFQYYNVYSERYELVLVESKRIKGKYISPKKLEEQVYKLKKQIESWRKNPNKIPFVIDSVEELIGYLNKGIIVHRYENFELKQVKVLLKDFPITDRKRHNPPIISLLNNYYIARLAELYSYGKEKNCFFWFYPDFNQNSSAQFFKNPTVNHLFSTIGFILPKETYRDEPYHLHEVNNDELILFSYDEPKLKSCEYIASAIKNFKIKDNLIGKYIFLKGNHYEKKNYFNNLRNAKINLNENDDQKLVIIDVDDKRLKDFTVAFRR